MSGRMVYTVDGVDLPDELVYGDLAPPHTTGGGPSAFLGASSTSNVLTEAMLRKYVELPGAQIDSSLAQKHGPIHEQQDAPIHEQQVAPIPEQQDAPIPEQQVAPIPEEEQDAPIHEQQDAPIPEEEVAPIPEQHDGPDYQHLGPIIEDDGWTLVRSRKFGMVRGLHPEEIHAPVEKACENEMVWSPKVASLRSAKKWAQARKGGCTFIKDGLAYFIYP